MRSPEVIGAEIVLEQANHGVVSTDLYIEGTNAGINVDSLIEQADDLYQLSEETFDEAIDIF